MSTYITVRLNVLEEYKSCDMLHVLKTGGDINSILSKTQTKEYHLLPKYLLCIRMFTNGVFVNEYHTQVDVMTFGIGKMSQNIMTVWDSDMKFMNLVVQASDEDVEVSNVEEILCFLVWGGFNKLVQSMMEWMECADILIYIACFTGNADMLRIFKENITNFGIWNTAFLLYLPCVWRISDLREQLLPAFDSMYSVFMTPESTPMIVELAMTVYDTVDSSNTMIFDMFAKAAHVSAIGMILDIANTRDDDNLKARVNYTIARTIAFAAARYNALEITYSALCKNAANKNNNV
jgi:hypothetical protein